MNSGQLNENMLNTAQQKRARRPEATMQCIDSCQLYVFMVPPSNSVPRCLHLRYLTISTTSKMTARAPNTPVKMARTITSVSEER